MRNEGIRATKKQKDTTNKAMDSKRNWGGHVLRMDPPHPNRPPGRTEDVGRQRK